jgi:hypothetical protein
MSLDTMAVYGITRIGFLQFAPEKRRKKPNEIICFREELKKGLRNSSVRIRNCEIRMRIRQHPEGKSCKDLWDGPESERASRRRGRQLGSTMLMETFKIIGIQL